MKRHRIVKDFVSCLKDNDIAIFSGEILSKEVFQCDRDGNFYVIDSPGIAISLALGIAMNIDKRVFLFTGDGEFLYELGAFAQAAVSKCKNLFCVVFDNDCYQVAGGHPTIFNALSNSMGVLFNFGFLTFDYTNHFKKKISVSKMSKTIDNLTGPAAIIIKVDKSCKKGLVDINYTKIDLRNRVMNFIQKDLGTSLFVPPISLDNIEINVDGGKN